MLGVVPSAHLQADNLTAQAYLGPSDRQLRETDRLAQMARIRAELADQQAAHLHQVAEKIRNRYGVVTTEKA